MNIECLLTTRFIAKAELARHPELAGRPVIVSSRPVSGASGVVVPDAFHGGESCVARALLGAAQERFNPRVALADGGVTLLFRDAEGRWFRQRR